MALVFLGACGREDEKAIETDGQSEITEVKPSLDQIAELFYEKLLGQTLIRTYGEDTGQTKKSSLKRTASLGEIITGKLPQMAKTTALQPLLKSITTQKKSTPQNLKVFLKS